MLKSCCKLLPGKSQEHRSLVCCRPWGPWESDTTERLHYHFSLSCTGEGNGTPLQCSCLENPRDGGAWWAAIYGVAQSRTRLKWLSSSNSSCCKHRCRFTLTWKLFKIFHYSLYEIPHEHTFRHCLRKIALRNWFLFLLAVRNFRTKYETWSQNLCFLF